MVCSECGSKRRHFKTCSKHPDNRPDKELAKGPGVRSNIGTDKGPEKIDKDDPLYKARKFAKVTKHLGVGIKNLKRGAQGLPPDENPFAGLIKTTDDKERARLTPRQIYRHTFLRLLQEHLAEDGEIFGLWADLEDTYSITKDGDNWAFAVEILKSKGGGPGTIVQTNIPTGSQKETGPPKKSFLQKIGLKKGPEAD